MTDSTLPEYLRNLAETCLSDPFPAMHNEARRRNFPIVGPEVGRFFLQFARLRQPRRILEIGSGFGYSAIWWALGAGPDVEIHCTEFDRKNVDLGREFSEQAGVSDRITWHQGDGLEIARRLDGPWDIIFCDADKHTYPLAWEFARNSLRPGDALLFDNMIWRGRVALPEKDWDRETEAIVRTTRLIYAAEDWDASLLPLRDGVLLALKWS